MQHSMICLKTSRLQMREYTRSDMQLLTELNKLTLTILIKKESTLCQALFSLFSHQNSLTKLAS